MEYHYAKQIATTWRSGLNEWLGVQTPVSLKGAHSTKKYQLVGCHLSKLGFEKIAVYINKLDYFQVELRPRNGHDQEEALRDQKESRIIMRIKYDLRVPVYRP